MCRKRVGASVGHVWCRAGLWYRGSQAAAPHTAHLHGPVSLSPAHTSSLTHMSPPHTHVPTPPHTRPPTHTSSHTHASSSHVPPPHTRPLLTRPPSCWSFPSGRPPPLHLPHCPLSCNASLCSHSLSVPTIWVFYNSLIITPFAVPSGSSVIHLSITPPAVTPGCSK